MTYQLIQCLYHKYCTTTDDNIVQQKKEVICVEFNYLPHRCQKPPGRMFFFCSHFFSWMLRQGSLQVGQVFHREIRQESDWHTQ